MSVGASIPEPIVREHIARLCDLMRPVGLDAVLVFHPANMLAFTGTPHASSDRLVCGLIGRDGRAAIVCPAFERPTVCGAERIASIRLWQEHEDPYACLAAALRDWGIAAGRVGVDGRIWLDAWKRFADAFGAAIRLEHAENLLREVRLCKSAAEIALMRAAHLRGERLYLELQPLIRAGVSEIELHRRLVARFERDGPAVDPMIQSGPNAAIPHSPTGARVLEEGDLIVVDSVIIHDGYQNDLTRTFSVGEPRSMARKAYAAVRAAHDAAIAAARPGVECRELDAIARKIIADAGFGDFFIHRLGHGIGIEGHEPPYLVAGNTEKLRPGMCMTIEPGIYVRGEFGVRIEDDIVITEDGCDVIRGELATDVSAALAP